jgi:prepilin-type N-terminal cleavage/methylation domain-containing protein
MPLPRDSRGFSLLELLTVLVVAGVLASLAMPRLDAMVSRARTRGALDQVSADVYLARNVAVREGQRTELRFRRRADRPECHQPRYDLVVRTSPERVVKVTRLELGSGACLQVGAVDNMVFNSRGLPAGFNNRKVRVENRGHADSVTYSLLGRTIRWY